MGFEGARPGCLVGGVRVPKSLGLLPIHWQVRSSPTVSVGLLAGRAVSWSLAAGPGDPKAGFRLFRGVGEVQWVWVEGWTVWNEVWGRPRDSAEKSSPAVQRHSGLRFYLWTRKIPWRKAWQPTPVILPGKFHGQRSQAGCSPWGHKELDTAEHSRHSLGCPEVCTALLVAGPGPSWFQSSVRPVMQDYGSAYRVCSLGVQKLIQAS